MGNQPESAVDPNGLIPVEGSGLVLERARVDGSDPQDNPFARAQKIAMDPGVGSAFYPAGWPGAMEDQSTLNQENSFNPNWQLWPGAMKQ